MERSLLYVSRNGKNKCKKKKTSFKNNILTLKEQMNRVSFVLPTDHKINITSY